MYILLGYSLSSPLLAFSSELVFLANDPITFWLLKLFIILYINRFIDLYTYIKIDFYIFCVFGFSLVWLFSRSSFSPHSSFSSICIYLYKNIFLYFVWLIYIQASFGGALILYINIKV